MGDMCNHKNNEGKFIIACDSDCEMKSDEMYCIRCGRRGNRIDIEQEGNAIDSIRELALQLPDEMCAAEAIDVIMANYSDVKNKRLKKAVDLSLDLLAKEAKRQGNEPSHPLNKYNLENESNSPAFVLVDQPFRLYKLP